MLRVPAGFDIWIDLGLNQENAQRAFANPASHRFPISGTGMHAYERELSGRLGIGIGHTGSIAS